MLGVLEAARRFDPERGYQFSTYASYWIRQQCQRYGVAAGLLIRLPPHVFWPCYKLRLEHAKLLAGLGPIRSQRQFAEMREEQSVSSERWSHFLRAIEIRHFSDLYRDEWIAMRSRPSEVPLPPTTTVRREIQAEAHYYLSFLNKRSRYILKLRYGFETHEHTLEEVGELLGITRERVRQIQKRAEEKLREIIGLESTREGLATALSRWTRSTVEFSSNGDVTRCVETPLNPNNNSSFAPIDTVSQLTVSQQDFEMTPQWVFSKQIGSSVRRDPNEAQLFKTEQAEEGEYAGTDALVREVLQNSIDASTGDGPVKVRLALHSAAELPPHEKLIEYFGRLGVALHKRDVECDAHGVLSLNTGFLVCEDFGTRGLGGDPLRAKDPPEGHQDREDFFWFWRNIGRSGKTGIDLGRWGLGKTVYRSVSRIGCMLGLTVRQSDQRRLLMGQAVLSIHEIDGVEYMPEGFWCAGCDSDELPLPIEDKDFLSSFAKDWRLQRTNEPGLSVVAPYVAEELCGEPILQAITVHFFLPIVRGDLVVEVSAPDLTPTLVDADTIARVCDDLTWDGPKRTKRQAPPPVAFVEACEASDGVVTSKLLGQQALPQLNEDSFAVEDLAILRERFADGELASAKIHISMPRRAGNAENGELKVFVQRDETASVRDSYYIREGMTITKITSQASRRGVSGLMIVDGGPLAEMLGDSEGPAHEDWDTSAERPNKVWKVWKGRIKFVRRIVDTFVELLSPQTDQPDFDLLSDFFSIERTTGPQKKRKPSDNGKPSPKFDPIPSTPKWYRIEGRRGGFRIAPTNSIPVPENALLKVAVAYDLPSGDPLKKWSEFDFEFANGSAIKLSGKGINATKQSRNVLGLTIQSDEFSFAAEGFDVHRDLFVRVDEISSDDMDELQ
ncbi:MAG: sigma-70 family RNA polymerase sigma factor [Pirellulales bacterium]|nr:sigma-70 family RNA polymerase sigma factor [Pirellulales bacterium]